MKETKRNYCVALVSMVVIAILCYRAFYFPENMFVKRRIALYVGLVVLVVLVPVLMIKISGLNRWLTQVIDRFCALGHKLQQNKKAVLLGVAGTLLGALLVYPITYAICHMSGTAMNNHRYLIALAIYGTLILCFIMRRIAYARADLLVFLAIMIMGTCAIFVTLRIPGTVPDDETHYRRTTEVIGFFTGSIYEAEEQTLREYVGNVQGHLYYDETSSGAYLKSLNDSYKKGEVIPYGVTRLSYYHIAYIVPACGIMLGRALGLPYAYTFMMGKWFTCLCYALLVGAAMRRVRRGKAVFAAVGMIPSMVFLASAYNYDYWIVGWTLLGFAKYLALYENDEPITTRQLADIIVTIIIGILPKIVYFPLLFPLLFLPKERLNKRQKVVIRVCAIMEVLGICAVLLAPIVTNPQAYADTRGEGVISTSGQISYIMSDPLRYIKLLFTFGLEYFSASVLGTKLQFFYYVGQGQYWGIPLVVMIMAAFLDRDEDSRMTVGTRIAIIIGALGGYVLAATAMYLAFTEVGSDTILGVQSRYAYPLLVPLLYAIAPNKVRLTGKKENWMIALVLLMSLPMIWNLNTLSVALY